MANTVIGRVVATEKNPTTIDNFTFWTDPELILTRCTSLILQNFPKISKHMFLVMRFVPFTTCSWVSMLVRKG